MTRTDVYAIYRAFMAEKEILPSLVFRVFPVEVKFQGENPMAAARTVARAP